MVLHIVFLQPGHKRDIWYSLKVYSRDAMV